MSSRSKCPYCRGVYGECGCDPVLVEEAELRSIAARDEAYKSSTSGKFLSKLLNAPDATKRKPKGGLRGPRRRLHL